MTFPIAAVRTLRPRQWVKNVLVLAAPLAAGQIADSDVWPQALTALVAFTLASAAVYAFNDAQDVEADRAHPVKCRRPVAAGELGVNAARVLALALVAAALTLAWCATTREFTALLLAYLLMQGAYALFLKHEPVLDLAVVAAGFLMRAVGGGLAAGLPISHWFLLVAGFGSLFMVAGKRYSELRTVGADGGTRRSLGRYTDTYLRFVWTLSAAATVLSYSLWATEQAALSDTGWHLISIAFFVLGILRYAVDVDAGTAGEPEAIVWGDRVLQGIGLLWLAFVMMGVTHV